MIGALVIIGLVAVQRLAEVAYARRNTRALLARGAVEVGRGHYPLFIVLHASWLAAILALLPPAPSIHWPVLVIVIATQAVRAWVIVTLGPYWTTRILTVPDAPLVRSGPYRFVRHPNYYIVIIEIAALPMVFGEAWVALVFSVLNAALLWWRIRVEDEALHARRGLSGG